MTEERAEQVADHRDAMLREPHHCAVDRFAYAGIQFDIQSADREAETIFESEIRNRLVLSIRHRREFCGKACDGVGVPAEPYGCPLAHPLDDARIVELNGLVQFVGHVDGARLAKGVYSSDVIGMALSGDDVPGRPGVDVVEQLSMMRSLESAAGVDDNSARRCDDHVCRAGAATAVDEIVDLDRFIGVLRFEQGLSRSLCNQIVDLIGDVLVHRTSTFTGKASK